ncbi:MAG: UDP-2,3-diacylglucosamine diphosphatase [Candidatus Onthomorpha sp.]
MNTLHNKSKNKIYFVSDFHFGSPDSQTSIEREKQAVCWLESIESSAEEIYLLGDVFDFWFEYRYVVPKGYVRFLGKLAQMSDSGCKIHFFCGNHDLWQRDYFEKELGFVLHRQALRFERDGKQFFVGHGDGLDKSDTKYKILNAIFKNKICIKLFASLHPRWAMAIGTHWSKQSRHSHHKSDSQDRGQNEPMYQYCLQSLQSQHTDFFIFGHRHLCCDKELKNHCRYINTGQWSDKKPFAEWDGENLTLKNFDQAEEIH